MKKFVLAGVAVAGLLAVPALAIQHERADMAKPMTRASVQAMVQTHFAEIDANHDGFITKDEAEARKGEMREKFQANRGERRDAMFARLDANHDGSVSKAEFDARPAHPEGDGDGPGGTERGGRHGGMMMGGKMGAMMFERADTDKDGRISLAEASAMHLAMFDRADANHDGTVTPEERHAAMQAFRAQRQARPKA